MRLLLNLLPLLLISSSVLGAPTTAPIDADTSPMNNVVASETEATETTVVEGTTVFEEATVATETEATESTVVETTTVIQAAVDTVVDEATQATVVETTTASKEAQLAEAMKKMGQLAKDLEEAQKKLDALNAEHPVVSTTENEPAKDIVANTTETVEETTTRMCNCEEATACRKESEDEMNSCTSQCENKFDKSWGNETAKYTACFTKNSAVITEAEKCLFKNQTESLCKNANGNTTIELPIWQDLNDIKFESENSKDTVWKTHEPKYSKLQEIFHCTKHCMHKKLGECTAQKKCAFKLPTHDEFAVEMKKCTKNNVKISTAILSTCTCLAWTEGVKEFQGSCGFLGNQYYIGKA